MIKRRYGIINKKGIFNVKTDIYMKCSYLAHFDNKSESEKEKAWNKFCNTYTQVYNYTFKLNSNIAIGLKNNKMLCIWEMGNKENTYKEFLIQPLYPFANIAFLCALASFLVLKSDKGIF